MGENTERAHQATKERARQVAKEAARQIAKDYARDIRELSYQHTRALRGWFMAYGVGAVVLLIGQGGLAQGLLSTWWGITGLTLVLAGLTFQVVCGICQKHTWSNINEVKVDDKEHDVDVTYDMFPRMKGKPREARDRIQSKASLWVERLEHWKADMITLALVVVGVVLLLIAVAGTHAPPWAATQPVAPIAGVTSDKTEPTFVNIGGIFTSGDATIGATDEGDAIVVRVRAVEGGAKGDRAWEVRLTGDDAARMREYLQSRSEALTKPPQRSEATTKPDG